LPPPLLLERSLAPVTAPVPAPAAAPAGPMVPPGQVALAVSARFGREPPAIPGGLHWRVYADRPDQTGIFRLLKDDKSASPTFVLPPGGYVVHVTFGLASANAAATSRRRARPASCPVAFMNRVYRRNLGDFKPVTSRPSPVCQRPTAVLAHVRQRRRKDISVNPYS